MLKLEALLSQYVIHSSLRCFHTIQKMDENIFLLENAITLKNVFSVIESTIDLQIEDFFCFFFFFFR